MERLDPALARLASDQAGLLSRAQLLRAGTTVAQIRAMIAAGRWRRVHPGVVATFTGDLPRPAILWAGLLYAGEGATLSHHTAAEVHGITDDLDETVHVTMPVERRVRSRRGVRIHYAHRLPRTRAPGRRPAIVNVNDTVLDLVDVSARPRDAIDWVTRACQRRRTTPERLRTALASRKKISWRPMVEAALADVASGAETPLELAYLHRVERAHGLPAGIRQRHRWAGARSQWIDVEYTDYAVRVELDGRIGHVGDGMFRDRRRDNDAAVEGFATLRFGWTDVTTTPARARDRQRPCSAYTDGRGSRSGAVPPARCRPSPHAHDHGRRARGGGGNGGAGWLVGTIRLTSSPRNVDRTQPEPSVSLPPLVEPAADLTVDEVRRYSRHLIIPDVGMDGQKRLKNAKVLVVGGGGLGSPALLYLAAAGVGTLGVIDFDVVDESNLQRQVIHGVSDLGKPKVQSARESVAEINPYVNFVAHETRLDSSNALEIFEPYDLVLDGTDNFATRYLVNDACVILGMPYVWGSIFRFDGQVSVFWDEYGPNYRDLYPEAPPPGMVPSCAEGGVLGVLCASIGAAMVTEAIKLITGIGEPLVGRLMIYDALAMTWNTVKVQKDPEAEPIKELIDYEAFCGVVSDEAQDAVLGSTISVKQLKEKFDRGESFLLVDVREPHEYEIVQIPGSVLIPKDRILSGEALAELPQDKPIVLHCKTGGRSAEALAALKQAGFADATHVQGGVTAWAQQIDTSLPTY